MIEAFFALFAIGTLGFWTLVLLGSIWMVYLTESEQNIGTVVTIVVVAVVAYFGYGVNIFTLILTNPGTFLLMGAGYFGIGALWFLLRWGFYVQGILDELSEFIEKLRGANQVYMAMDYRTSQTIPFLQFPIPSDQERYGVRTDDPVREAKSSEEREQAWSNTIGFIRRKQQGHYDFPPNYRKSKARIMLWIGMWPFSMLGNLLHRPVICLLEWIYARMGKLVQGLTQYLIRRQM